MNKVKYISVSTKEQNTDPGFGRTIKPPKYQKILAQLYKILIFAP